MSDIEKMRAALLAPDFSHTRQRDWFGGQVYAYRYAPQSPTGVMIAAVLPVREFDALLATMRAAGTVPVGGSPLSPCEAR
jgi:hypothetical protein